MLHVVLSSVQRAELEELRDHAAQAYLRERAAALLKVAEGLSAARVARERLLKRHKPFTVERWVRRYQEEGLAGLRIRKGRGRKPAFSPCRFGSLCRQRGATSAGTT